MATLTTVSSNYGTINGIQKDGYSVFGAFHLQRFPQVLFVLHHLKNRKASNKLMMRLLSVPSPCSISPTRTVYIRKNSMITRTFISDF